MRTVRLNVPKYDVNITGGIYFIGDKYYLYYAPDYIYNDRDVLEVSEAHIEALVTLLLKEYLNEVLCEKKYGIDTSQVTFKMESDLNDNMGEWV